VRAGAGAGGARGSLTLAGGAVGIHGGARVDVASEGALTLAGGGGDVELGGGGVGGGGAVLRVTPGGALLTGAGAVGGVNLAAQGLSSARLSASGGPATVSGAGASLVSTSNSEGLVLATAPSAGNTSGVRIVTGSAAGGGAGDVVVAAGDGGAAGGSVALRPGAGTVEGAVEVFDAGGAALLRAAGGALRLRGAALGLGAAPAPPTGAPLLVNGASSLLEVIVTGASDAAVAFDIGGDVVSGQVLWVLNAPASAGPATVAVADGLLSCDEDVVIPRGSVAAFITWRCAAGDGGCMLAPLKL